MRVCLVSQEYPPQISPGGMGTQTWNKARSLARLGHTVHVLSCAAGPGPDLETEMDGDVTVHRIQFPQVRPGESLVISEPAVYWLGYSWAVLRELNRLLQSAPFDLVNFPDYGAEGFAFQLNRADFNWVPVVVQLHGPLTMFAERIGWPDRDSAVCRVGGLMEELSIRLADGLMASSANIADFVSDSYGLPREAIDIVHCGIDTEAFQPRVEPEPDGRPTVLFVGTLTEEKGLGSVFEAVLALRSKYPDIRLQILGNGEGPLAERLRRQARAAGAEASVEFHGFVADRSRLPEYYRRAHVFASPARHEPGVANVYVEAMACGCPVVASRTGGAPEAVVDGETGFLVPPDDVEATAAALDRILGDAALRRRMAGAARRRVEEYFAVDKYIGRVLAAYEKAIARSPR